MAATSSSFLIPTNFLTKHHTTQRRSLPASPWCFRPVAQQQSQGKEGTDGESKEKISLQQEPPQPMARSKNMTMEYGGQWLSSVTRHVRLYAAYIDPANGVFDQTQMDKLTLLLDTTNEFIWTPEACNKVYQYFQELVDLYEVCRLHFIMYSDFFAELLTKTSVCMYVCLLACMYVGSWSYRIYTAFDRLGYWALHPQAAVRWRDQV